MVRVVSVNLKGNTYYSIESSFLGLFKRYKCAALHNTWWDHNYLHHSLYTDLSKCLEAYEDYCRRPTPVIITKLEKALHER